MSAVAAGRTRTELGRALAEARAGWRPPAWLAAGAIAVAALVPFLSLPGVRVDALAQTIYLAVAATALGLLVGTAGLPSLGAGAFVAIGAFTSALLVAREDWPLEAAALSGALAALGAGLLFGGVVRLRPAFVAASTWALAWLVWLGLLAFPSISGGSQGLIVPERKLLGLDATPTVHFEVALALLVLTALGIAAVRRGAPGSGALGSASGAAARNLARRPARAQAPGRLRRIGVRGRARGRALRAARGCRGPGELRPVPLLQAPGRGAARRRRGDARTRCRRGHARADRAWSPGRLRERCSCRSSDSTQPWPRCCSSLSSRSEAVGSSPGRRAGSLASAGLGTRSGPGK